MTTQQGTWIPPRTTHKHRAKFIGGSDVAKVLGVSPWGTAVDLWLEKTGQRAPAVLDADRMRVLTRGHRLEPYVRAMFLDKLRLRGHDVQLVSTNQRFIDREHDCLAAETDAIVRIDGVPCVGEFKSATGYLRKAWGDEDTDEIPMHYTAQVMHGLGITGLETCWVGALIGLDDVTLYRVDRDDALLASMRAKSVGFWRDCVLANRAPDPLRFADVKSLWPEDDGHTVEATPEVAALVEQLAAASRRGKKAELEAEAARLQIGHYMRDAATLTVGGRRAIDFHSYTQRRLDIDGLRQKHPSLTALFEGETAVRSMRVHKQFA